jgi:hypothetical protein
LFHLVKKNLETNMASVTQNKRTSESKYVTIFNDGSDGHTDVDISFREPLLSRPSDHFLVGVDNLTVNLNNLSMIPVSQDDSEDFLFQIVRLSGRTDITVATLNAQQALYDAHIVDPLNAPAHDPLEVNLTSYIFPEGYKFKIHTKLQNIQQLAYQLDSFFEGVNANFIKIGVKEALVHGGRNNALLDDPTRLMIPTVTGNHPDIPAPAYTAANHHVRCDITGDGRFRIRGTRLFWSTHYILFNSPEYMYMFNGARRQTRTVDVHFDEAQFCYSVPGNILFGSADVDTHRIFFSESANGKFCSLRAMPVAAAGPPAVVGWNTTSANNLIRLSAAGAGAPRPGIAGATLVGQTYRNAITTMVFGANLLSTSDRRVALELGCSLPIVNNPLVDHGLQAPDTVIGRWMFNPMVRIKTTMRGQEMTFEGMAPDVYELQNATDRVQYHALMPQDKIHMLRIKMYARIRVYDKARDRFTMVSETYPMENADWWHTRIHFISKD